MRIALLSPMPPHISGLADYSADLLPHLRDLIDVDIYDLDSIDSLILKSKEYDAVIVQIGQDKCFYESVRVLKKIPAIAVIHDLNLSGIYGGYYLENKLVWKFFFEILKQEGLLAYVKVVAKFIIKRKCPNMMDYTLTTALAKNAKKIIVHSSAAKEIFQTRHPYANVEVIAHGCFEHPQVTTQDRNLIRKKLGLQENAFIISSFGNVDERKRIHIAIEAFKKLKSQYSDLIYIIIGRLPEIGWNILKDIDSSSGIIITGRVDMDVFYDYIRASDICINLRYPWIGEESGPMLRVMSCGIPVVVSDTGSFAYIPDNCVYKASVGNDEEYSLINILKDAYFDRNKLEATGILGRQYILNNHLWHNSASRYVNTINDFIGEKRL